MADYDSDSSGAEDVATNVLLGYASTEPTNDEFSQLGGHPTWLDGQTAPSGTLAKCKVCNSLMSLLLQLNGDIPDRFPGHARRLYVWACRRKACRRKQGSIRAFRGIRSSDAPVSAPDSSNTKKAEGNPSNSTSQPRANLGETLFGVKSPGATQSNPFTMSGNPGSAANPFASASSLAAKPAQKPSTEQSLPQTFAEKVRISSPPPTAAEAKPSEPKEAWPDKAAFPEPYPAYHIDADTEYLEPGSQEVPSNARLDRGSANGEGSSSAAEDKLAFESTMDKTFQRFADRLAQNPEQVLRYEFAGQPLLYSKSDAFGKLLAAEQENPNAKVQTIDRASGSKTSKVPKCPNCGAGRTFELQLTPHAITELEADDMSLDGMDWGTILMYSCSADCQEKARAQGEIGYFEEWVGVQWEEIVTGNGR